MGCNITYYYVREGFEMICKKCKPIVEKQVEWLKKKYKKEKGFFSMDELIDKAFKDVTKNR